MALFSRKKSDKDKAVEKEAKETSNIEAKQKTSKSSKEIASSNVSDLKKQFILLPHITEKANDLVQNQGYVFEIKGRANKTMVAQEIEKKFKVKVRKVNIIASHSKPISYKRKKQSYKKSPQKAVVYLKEGYKIDLS